MSGGRLAKKTRMKTLQIIPLLALSALTGGSALAQITYTGLERSVAATAQASPAGDFASVVASGSGNFDDSALAEDFSQSGFGIGSADQISTVGVAGFSYSGSASASAGGFASASGTSFFSVEFTVASTMEYTLSGFFESSGGSQPVSGRISRMTQALGGSFFQFSGPGIFEAGPLGGPLSLSGLLDPGTYTFTAQLEALADGFGSNPAVGGGIQRADVPLGQSAGIGGNLTFSVNSVSEVPEANTVVAGFVLGGLAVWQARRRRA